MSKQTTFITSNACFIQFYLVASSFQLVFDLDDLNNFSIQVLFFKDFTPCPIPQSSGKALTSIGWKSYGLTLGSIVNQCGYSLLEWEGLPPYAHIDIVLHYYHKQYPRLCYILQFQIWLTSTLVCFLISVHIACIVRMYECCTLYVKEQGPQKWIKTISFHRVSFYRL